MPNESLDDFGAANVQNEFMKQTFEPLGKQVLAIRIRAR